jgi:hypothetical protein
MLQFGLSLFVFPIRFRQTRESMPDRFMRRIFILLFSLWLLAGCQAKEFSPLVPSTASESVLSPDPSAPAVTATSMTIPSEAATWTPASPTTAPEEFVVKARKASVWDAPENENKYWNLQTQLILGEKVLVVDHRGEWSKIVAVEQPSKKDPHGYPGWVRSEFLASGWPTAQQYAVAMRRYNPLRTEPNGPLRMNLSLDTRLPVESTQKDWVQVLLPDGGPGWLRLSDVRLTENLSSPVPTDGLFALAEELIGVPYWWGGTTSDSFDCSGFLYRVFHAYGINLGRDSGDQASGGEIVAREEMRKGDLIFTSKTDGGSIYHVAMYWGNNTVLDADTPRGVAIRTMAERLKFEFWVTARRVLP